MRRSKKHKKKNFEEMKAKSDSTVIAAHHHPLMKRTTVYDGYYSCNVCSLPEEGWVYHCDGCDFDAHPHCAFPKADAAEKEAN
jgi:hypothetical protein